MVSPPPLEYGCTYHIYNRGNNGENIFVEERNYRHLLHCYAQYVAPVVDTYAYCLLRNHFHLLVRVKTVEEQEQTLRVAVGTPLNTLRVFTPRRPSQQFGTLFNAYAKGINKAYQRTGSLFQNPLYHALLSEKPTRLWRDQVLAWFQGPSGFEAAHQQMISEALVAPLVVDDLD